jgi:hypothetical protein
VELPVALPVALRAALRAALPVHLPVELRGLPTHRQTVPRRQRRLPATIQARLLPRLSTPLQSSSWSSS